MVPYDGDQWPLALVRESIIREMSPLAFLRILHSYAAFEQIYNASGEVVNS